MDSYLNLARDIRNSGRNHDDRTKVGTASVTGRLWRHDLRTGFPLLTTKQVFFRGIVKELCWFLSGDTNEKTLSADGVKIWADWATEEKCQVFGRQEGDLGPIYGWQWRHFGAEYVPIAERLPGYKPGGFDQIATLIEDIRKTPNSRRLIVTAWNPAQAKQVELPPCHTLWQIKCDTESNEMDLVLYARSIDTFLGLPFNIASYALLLTMIATCTGYTPRDLVVEFGDVHIYRNHFDEVDLQLTREPYPLPKLVVNDSLLLSGINGLLSFDYGDVELVNYQSHPPIKAPVAV